MVQAHKAGVIKAETEMVVILSTVADYFSLSTAELRGTARARVSVLSRQIAMYIAKQMTSATLQEIGQAFGGKHHTTVMHSIAKIDEQRRVDKDLNRVITTILRKP